MSNNRRRIRAHPTTYAGQRFRSRLEARWAAFFDLAGWRWRYEPIDLEGWVPDFLVTFPCRHSCGGEHRLYVEVKPYWSVAEFAGHPVLEMDPYVEPHPAAFGLAPDVTRWEMCHGSGGGEYSVTSGWITDPERLWREAGNLVQWRPR
jgi:hypothetical protein